MEVKGQLPSTETSYFVALAPQPQLWDAGPTPLAQCVKATYQKKHGDCQKHPYCLIGGIVKNTNLQ